MCHNRPFGRGIKPTEPTKSPKCFCEYDRLSLPMWFCNRFFSRDGSMKIASVICLFFLFTPIFAQEGIFPAEDSQGLYVKKHYAKHDFYIPMRDGVRLFTAVYTPNDPSGTYPFLLTRTPYGVKPYGADQYKENPGPLLSFLQEGFIFVHQDVRGRYMSEGKFVNMRPHIAAKKPGQTDESTDTYDTIEWLLKNVSNNNGRVGIRGISYPGFYTSAGIIDSHPAIKAASPQAPIADWYFDDMHHHGAFSLNLAFNFFAGFGRPRPEPTPDDRFDFAKNSLDRYRYFMELGPLSNADKVHFKGDVPFWNEMAAHPDYDEFWQARNILPHLKNINCAVMVVGGLYDAEDLYGPWKTYANIESKNPDIINTIVMGPWRHGGWKRTDGSYLGDSWFGANTSEWYQEHVDLPFFMHHLKDGPDPKLPEALVFETGSNRWRFLDAWPPPKRKIKKLYLGEGMGLGWQKSADEEGFHEYTSDPAKPVPYTRHHGIGWEARYMAEDQRFAAQRPDVLVYESPVLAEDVTLAGPIDVTLWVSTTGSDADWVVKLVDLLPPEHEPMYFDEEMHQLGGAQLMVRSEIFRGRYRNSYERPEPFIPGEITKVSFPLQDVLHTFKKGHRIMIHIQSSMFPLVDRNPQNYVPNIFEATQEDFIKADHRIYYGGKHASALEVGVLDQVIVSRETLQPR